ncbi:MAG: hypothetical protein R3F60_15815 [bacterium]
MGKVLVVVLGLAAVGALAWALMSPSSVDPAPAAGAPTSAAAAPSVASAKAPGEAEGPSYPVRRPPPVVHNALPPRPVQVGDAPAPPPADPAAQAAPAIPSAALADVQDTVRSYHGNLPRSGKIPERITLEEVLPSNVIRQLGAPANAQLVMLGTWNASDERAFTDVLKMEGRFQEMLGVSWLDAEGVEQRNYVQLTVPTAPAE